MVEDNREETGSLGAWEDADLSATALRNAGVGADAGLPPETRFLSGVAKLIRRRKATPGADSDPARLAVFLLEGAAPAQGFGDPPKRVPMLDNGLTVLGGRLWFVNSGVVSGHYVDLQTLDDDTLFKLVTDDQKRGDKPAIIFDPRTPTPSVRYYRNGLRDPDAVELVSVAGADVTLDRIFEVVGHVYRSCLITPEAQARAGKLWEDGEKWWACEDAEDLVQLHLRVGLTTAFPTCTVRHEQTDTPGRLDLEIEESDALDRSRITRYAVLELKILRSFGSTGKKYTDEFTLSWIESGVKQAATYRDQRGARAGALCCFDMRKEHTGEECFNHVRDLAKDLMVTLRVWFMFATSERYREFATKKREL
jgi:hypothetical protein